jgi:hypothetical protein
LPAVFAYSSLKAQGAYDHVIRAAPSDPDVHYEL